MLACPISTAAKPRASCAETVLRRLSSCSRATTQIPIVPLARVRTLLRQYETSEDAVFMIGPYTFRPSSKLLLNPTGSKVRLTEKETSILRYLYRASQRPVSRETLLQEVWAYNSGVTTHTLETHIYRLRQKI